MNTAMTKHVDVQLTKLKERAYVLLDLIDALEKRTEFSALDSSLLQDAVGSVTQRGNFATEAMDKELEDARG